jgi:hypothetical protein
VPFVGGCFHTVPDIVVPILLVKNPKEINKWERIKIKIEKKEERKKKKEKRKKEKEKEKKRKSFHFNVVSVCKS